LLLLFAVVVVFDVLFRNGRWSGGSLDTDLGEDSPASPAMQQVRKYNKQTNKQTNKTNN
jgi:hypothetical protein